MIRRLLLSYLAVTAIVLLVLEVPLAWFFADRERQGILVDLERDSVAFATRYEDALQHGAAYTADAAVTYSAATGARVVVVDASGLSIVDTDGDLARDFSSRTEVASALGGRSTSGVRRSETLGTDIYYAAVPVASAGDVYGAVRITFEAAEVSARVREFLGGLGIIGVTVLTAMALVSWVIARSFARPVRELSATAAAIAAGDLDARSDPGDAPTEIVDVSRSFNEMADRVQDLIGRERRFVADASHQLRTPLTALRLRLETIEEGVAERDRNDLEAAIAETTRLADLVDQLLVLARSEIGLTVTTAIDVGTAVRERGDLWRAAAEERGVAITVDVPSEPLEALAVEGCVEQVLDNYLANALTVSPPGGTIVMTARPAAETVELRVRDEGPGLPDEQKTHAFERFWRGSTGHPGTGLGLSIVRTLAEASGGSASLQDSPSGGIDAVLILRQAPPVGPDRETSTR